MAVGQIVVGLLGRGQVGVGLLGGGASLLFHRRQRFGVEELVRLGHQDRAMAVSYTHLDVYKRQDESCPTWKSGRKLLP